jgi:predicted phosphodiesterase
MITGRLPVDPERAEAYNLPLIRSLLTEENLEWLRRLPSSRELWLGGRRILMCHGSPWDPLEEYIYPDFDGFERFAALDYDLVLLGHTHWPLVRRRGRTLVVNPGSCGQPRDRVPGASYARVDLDEMEAELRRADFEPYRLLAEAQLLGLPPKLIEYFGRPS